MATLHTATEPRDIHPVRAAALAAVSVVTAAAFFLPATEPGLWKIAVAAATLVTIVWLATNNFPSIPDDDDEPAGLYDLAEATGVAAHA